MEIGKLYKHAHSNLVVMCCASPNGDAFVEINHFTGVVVKMDQVVSGKQNKIGTWSDTWITKDFEPYDIDLTLLVDRRFTSEKYAANNDGTIDALTLKLIYREAFIAGSLQNGLNKVEETRSVEKEEKEYILCSAIWYKELPLERYGLENQNPINVDRGIVFCGHRHPHCQYSMIAITGKRSVLPDCGEYEQGFLTSKNRFVDRAEARAIATVANQIKNPSIVKRDLFSEDIY